MAFIGVRVAVFCDGDFWHGRELERRLERLAKGHNAPYWMAKITANVARDQRNTAALEAEGWVVVRLWESDIKRDPEECARQIVQFLDRTPLRRR